MQPSLRAAIYRSKDVPCEVHGMAKHLLLAGAIHFETLADNMPEHLRAQWNLPLGEVIQIVARTDEIEWVTQ